MNGKLGSALAIVLFGSTVWTQSLGDAAQREKQRREALAKQKGGRATQVVTEEELRKHSGGPPLDMGAEPRAATPATGSQASREASRPTGTSESAGGDAERRQVADELRGRMRQCQANVEAAQANLAAAEEHRSFVSRKTNADYPNDEARQRLAGAQRRLESARRACDAIEDEARVARVPPGSIR